METTLYPLLTRPIVKPKVWGGRRLAAWGKSLPETGVPYGESWEVADLARSSPGGGGGGPERTEIANGPLAGRSIASVLESHRAALLGPEAPDGPFPLLVKYLDAREHLSVQVHPSEAYAESHPGAHVKTECWYVLDAEPGAVLFKGLRTGTTPERLAEVAGTAEIETVLEAVPAIPGEMHDLPSGTVHALGAGVLVAEVQVPSDTTFRLYDWVDVYDRPSRSLHIARALECARFDTAPPSTRLAPGARASLLVRNAHFSVSELVLGVGEVLGAGGDGRSFAVVMVLEGALSVVGGAGAGVYGRGATLLVPADGSGFEAVEAVEGDTRVLVARHEDASAARGEPD